MRSSWDRPPPPGGDLRPEQPCRRTGRRRRWTRRPSQSPPPGRRPRRPRPPLRPGRPARPAKAWPTPAHPTSGASLPPAMSSTGPAAAPASRRVSRWQTRWVSAPAPRGLQADPLGLATAPPSAPAPLAPAPRARARLGPTGRQPRPLRRTGGPPAAAAPLTTPPQPVSAAGWAPPGSAQAAPSPRRRYAVARGERWRAGRLPGGRRPRSRRISRRTGRRRWPRPASGACAGSSRVWWSCWRRARGPKPSSALRAHRWSSRAATNPLKFARAPEKAIAQLAQSARARFHVGGTRRSRIRLPATCKPIRWRPWWPCRGAPGGDPRALFSPEIIRQPGGEQGSLLSKILPGGPRGRAVAGL